MGPTRGHSLIPGYRRALLPIIGDLRLGGHYQFEGNAGGTFTRCEPPRLLSVSWEIGGTPSWLTVSLAEGPARGARLAPQQVSSLGRGPPPYLGAVCGGRAFVGRHRSRRAARIRHHAICRVAAASSAS